MIRKKKINNTFEIEIETQTNTYPPGGNGGGGGGAPPGGGGGGGPL